MEEKYQFMTVIAKIFSPAKWWSGFPFPFVLFLRTGRNLGDTQCAMN